MGIRTGSDDNFIGDSGIIICEWIGYCEWIWYSERTEYVAYFGYDQWDGYNQWIEDGGYGSFHRDAAEDGNRRLADDQLSQRQG